MLNQIQKIKNYLFEYKARFQEAYNNYKKLNAERIIKTGHGRTLTIASHAVFYFTDRIMDLLLPMLAIPTLFGIVLNPAISIPLTIGIIIFVVLLTINESINYIKILDKLKEDINTNEKNKQKLADMDFEISQVYNDIEKLKNIVTPNTSSITDSSNKSINNIQQVATETNLINHTLFNKILNKIHTKIIAGMRCIKDAHSKLKTVIDLKNIIENLMKIYGLIKFLLLSMALLPVLPVVMLLTITKIFYIQPIENLKNEIANQQEKYPDLLLQAQYVLEFATKEKELLEVKAQALNKSKIIQPLLFTDIQYGKKLSDDIIPQLGIILQKPKDIKTVNDSIPYDYEQMPNSALSLG
jgi:hypothetical protein